MGAEATLNETFGLLYIAVVVSAALYGAGILQFWLYIRKYHAKDPLIVQFVVIAVIICDTVQQALLCHAGRLYREPRHPRFRRRASDRNIYIASRVSLIAQHSHDRVVFQLCDRDSCTTASPPQLVVPSSTLTAYRFYCWRIYKVGQSILLAGAVSLVSWSSCVLLIGKSLLLCHLKVEPMTVHVVYAVHAVQFKLLADLITLQKLAIAVDCLTAAADILISIVLILLLKLSKTGFKKSTDLINRLIIFTFNTGLPTSLSALVCAICVIAFPSTFFYIFFFLLLGRFYTNSLLVTLNSREFIKSANQQASGEQYSLEHSARNTTRVRNFYILKYASCLGSRFLQDAAARPDYYPDR
ncbi:hypothetical protein GGX14DRAFT_694622 [Mycena pura]|uniref:DUF6534 domain-containing protein n=1 Tax=Mycena pura TaxID=153505 RepID=A0AAD6YLG7_9AGAR|nr:hypothetical protein GGX14DRAFT_694622 [Mycena pura]